MPRARPVECPECGHERIVQRPQHLRTETELLRVNVSSWICGLCGFQWRTLPVRGRARLPEIA